MWIQTCSWQDHCFLLYSSVRKNRPPNCWFWVSCSCSSRRRRACKLSIFTASIVRLKSGPTFWLSQVSGRQEDNSLSKCFPHLSDQRCSKRKHLSLAFADCQARSVLSISVSAEQLSKVATQCRNASVKCQSELFCPEVLSKWVYRKPANTRTFSILATNCCPCLLFACHEHLSSFTLQQFCCHLCNLFLLKSASRIPCCC